MLFTDYKFFATCLQSIIVSPFVRKNHAYVKNIADFGEYRDHQDEF